MVMHALHLAVRRRLQGVPVPLAEGVEIIGTMGYLDNTAAATTAAPIEVAREAHAVSDMCRGLVHTLGQRNPRGNMKMPEYGVQAGDVSIHQFLYSAGGGGG